MCRKLSDRTTNIGKRNQYYMDSDSEQDHDFYNMCVDGADDKPYVIQIIVEGISLPFEVDTGSKISAINEQLYLKCFKNIQVTKSRLRLRAYTGSMIEPTGPAGGGATTAHDLPLFIIPVGGPPLLGRAWLRSLQLNQISINMNNIHRKIIREGTF